jgi:polysaccharide export outer membrane protein
MHKLNIRINKILMVVGLALAGLLSPNQIVAQEGFSLQVDVQDILKIRVGNWNITRKVHDEWAGLSGDYTVGMDGKISFPYIGSVDVKGHSFEDISQSIATKLQVAIGLSREPAVATEIAS